MKRCPKCGKPVDQGGIEWVQLFFDEPFKWSPVCHRDCAMGLKSDMRDQAESPE